MEYITEVRGGWDEWSDKYEVILGVIIEGREFERFVKNEFVDQNGNRVEVDFPTRKTLDREITLQRYDPSYQRWTVNSLAEFENIVDTSSMTIDISKI